MFVYFLKQFPYFPFFMVFKIPKDEVCFSISFLSFFFSIFSISLFEKEIQQTIYVDTHVIFFEFGLHFQICILTCVMCLI
jgi:hypothetical protein